MGGCLVPSGVNLNSGDPIGDPDRYHQPVSDLATGAGISLAGRVLGRGLTMLGQVVIARLFGPGAYGLYGIGWTLLRMGAVASPLGMDQAIIRFASPEREGDPARRKGIILKGLMVGFGAGIVTGVAIYLLAPWLAVVVFSKPELVPILRWFAPGFATTTGLKIAADTTRVTQRMQYGVVVEEFLQPGFNLFLVLLAYALGYGIAGAAAAGTISFTVALAFALLFVIRLFPELTDNAVRIRASLREMFRFSLPASFARSFAVLMMWMDRLFIGAILAGSAVGAYQAASLASTLFSIVLAAFNAVFSPMIAEYFHRERTEELAELYRVSTKWGLYASLPVFVLCLVSPALVLGGVFGPGYLQAAAALSVLSVGQLTVVGVGAVGVLLAMAGYPRRWMATSLAALIVEIALCLTLIPQFGLLGGAVSVAVSLAGLFISGLIQVRWLLGLWPYDRRFFKGILAALASAAMVITASQLIPGPDTIKLIGVTALDLVTFLAVLRVLGLDAEDRLFFELIVSRLPRINARD